MQLLSPESLERLSGNTARVLDHPWTTTTQATLARAITILLMAPIHLSAAITQALPLVEQVPLNFAVLSMMAVITHSLTFSSGTETNLPEGKSLRFTLTASKSLHLWKSGSQNVECRLWETKFTATKEVYVLCNLSSR